MITFSLAAKAAVIAATLLSGHGYTVQPGDTLSAIAASHSDSLAAVEAANPGIADPNLIYAGQVISLPGLGTAAATGDHEPDGDRDDQSAPSAPAAAPQAPAPAPAAAPVQGAPGGGGTASAPSGISIPGMPQGLADCIWMRESTDGTNPAANGNQFGIIPASGYNVAGMSVAQQEQVAGQIYATAGGAAWSADGCPGT